MRGMSICKYHTKTTREIKPLTLIIPDIQNLIIIVLLYIVLKKIRTNTALHGTQFDIAHGNHALCAQPAD